METGDLFLVFLAFAAGGIIKGATGAGAPLLAVPLMVVLRDVQFAVAVFVLPNIVPNIWQFWLCRKAPISKRFVISFALAGGAGAGMGTLALAGWRPEVLMITVATMLIAYIFFRLFKPAWELPMSAASKLVIPAGFAAGVLQGASGLSAPVSLTFLNAIRLDRVAFMATISLFFVALGLVQLPMQIVYGIMTPERFTYSLMSLVPLLMFKIGRAHV